MSNEEIVAYNEVASKYLGLRRERYYVKSNTCLDLDKDAKNIAEELVALRKLQGKQIHINFLAYVNRLVLDKFNQYDCRNRIELTRLDDMGNVITKSAIESEKSVLGKSNSDVNVYSLIGAFVVLSTLVILLTNKK